MEHIKKTLDKIIQDLKVKKKKHPESQLRKYLTKEELRHIKFCHLRQRVMTLNVDSSVWLYLLNFKKKELVEKLGLKDIRMRIGEID
ncbi:MAG: DUF721 domain-containing protein [Candidatus Omnitrophica bacterium]|nr:DUF721 domain-containing protein [Candidatus Omnitrophota bacterium]MCM8770454.1 DUF721 domain-containing protein [Candidatus Omnitrophota bacterium]